MRTEPGPPLDCPFDLADPAAYATGSAHGRWHRLRQTQPVRRDRTPSGVPYWSVFTHRDCATILLDTNTFSSASGTILDSIGAPDPAGGRTVVLADPPQHAQLRALTMRHLGPAAVRAHADAIRERVHRLVAALPLGEQDIMPALRRLPMLALGPLLDLPERDWDAMVFHAIGCIAPADPEFTRGSTTTTLQHTHAKLFHLIHTALRSGNAFADDLRSITLSGGPTSSRDVLLNLYSTLIGGNTTTPHVAAHLLLRLADQPELWDAEPAHLPALVEEGVRWATPTQSLVRRVTTDIELGGRQLRAGDWVAAWVASANRDESVFPDPYRFTPGRPASAHLGFGRGAHYCAGAQAARLLLSSLIEELAHRRLRFSLVQEPQHLSSTAINGITTMPMRFFR
ncbi:MULTISPECIES: cytochrome P450 [unclassified Crossiella]|uniref:cytochrome P450 n=1 Tax=unclassified Crossiella TaxID=2620835 RepID=UPI002000186D|nr:MULTISPECIES: cytochrome P450 [unclassified Crossiella]MCK2244207.1 cytochrome P450 [Crossiella sp. S99.2]MCK2258011.1 cytochrome P450 [Crossiella sp. S99.1]